MVENEKWILQRHNHYIYKFVIIIFLFVDNLKRFLPVMDLKNVIT